MHPFGICSEEQISDALSFQLLQFASKLPQDQCFSSSTELTSSSCPVQLNLSKTVLSFHASVSSRSCSCTSLFATFLDEQFSSPPSSSRLSLCSSLLSSI